MRSLLAMCGPHSTGVASAMGATRNRKATKMANNSLVCFRVVWLAAIMFSSDTSCCIEAQCAMLAAFTLTLINGDNSTALNERIASECVRMR